MAWHDDASKAVAVPLHYHSHGEYHGPCPECGGTKRFCVWRRGNYWCRECGHRGWWAKGDDIEGLKADAIRSRKQHAEGASQRLLLEGRGRALVYRRRCLSDPDALAVWDAEGIGTDEIHRWGLGYSDACPAYPDSPSLVIPVWQFGHLVDIRHRLIEPKAERDGKYRSEFYGAMPRTFNLDAVLGGSVVVVEGEKKAIVFAAYGIRAVGIPGLKNTQDLFAMARRYRFAAVVALDPDAREQGWTMADDLLKAGCRSVRVSFFPFKPDDTLLDYGYAATVAILRQAMVVERKANDQVHKMQGADRREQL